MIGIVLMTALVSGGQGADCCGYAGWYSGYGVSAGYWGYGGSCGCATRCGCCGIVIPSLMGGEKVTAAEQKKWDDYLTQLNDESDRKEVNYLWTHADLGAKRKLLTKIPPPEEKETDKPLSAAEQKKWDTYVKKLEGDKKKQAEENWKNADLSGKRKLIQGVPEDK